MKHMKTEQKKKLLKLIVAGGVVALAVTAWTIIGHNSKNKQRPVLEMTQAKKMDISKSVQGTGALTPENSAEIKVPTGIRLTEIKRKTGEDVKTGDVLAMVDPTSVSAELLSAKEKLTEIDKKIKKADKKKAEYYTLLKDKQHLEEKIGILTEIAKTNQITASMNGTITMVSGTAGEVQNKDTSKDTNKSTTDNATAANNGGTLEKQSSAGNAGKKYEFTRLNETSDPGIEQPISFPEITLPVPKKGETQLREIAETDTYTGTIEWDCKTDKYEADKVYSARIVITAKQGYFFLGEINPKVNGAAVSDVKLDGAANIKSVAFTAIYPATEKEETIDPPTPPAPASDSKDENNQGNYQPDEAGSAGQLSGAEGGFEGGGAVSSGGGGVGTSAATEDAKEVNTELVSVFTIASGDKMKVNIQVDEMDILTISPGQQADVVLNALPGEKFQGTITLINKVGTSNNGVTKYGVEITLNKNEKMLSGMNVSASVKVEEKKGVVAIPAAAVLEENGKSYIYTAVDDKTGAASGKKEITTGLTNGTDVEIVKGMKEGTDIYYQPSETPSSDEMDMADGEGMM